MELSVIRSEVTSVERMRNAQHKIWLIEFSWRFNFISSNFKMFFMSIFALDSQKPVSDIDCKMNAISVVYKK